MMNEEELTQQELQQLEQQMQQQEQIDQQNRQSLNKRETLSEKADRVREGVNQVGKNIENVGKIEEKAADFLDGGQKAAKAGAEVGSKTSSASEQSAKAAQKAAEARAKIAHAAAETAKATKEGAEKAKVASEAGTKAGVATTKAGVATTKAGVAASSAYGAGVPVAAAGGVITAAGATGTAAGAAGTAGSASVEAGAATAEATARAAEMEAKAEAAAAGATAKAAQASKAGTNTAKKASDMKFSDKLRQRGKLNQARGKQIQEKSKNFDSDKLIDRVFGEASILGKLMKGVLKAYDPKVVGIVLCLMTIIIPIITAYILSPMFFMDQIRNSIADPDRVEKVYNYISGLGFQDSEEAFYKEVDYLNEHYDKNLDFPYIMSALYYIDIYYGKSEYFTTDDNKKLCSSLDMNDKTSKMICSKNQLGLGLAKYYLNEAGSTTGTGGLVYSANKLYRLRQLAKAQFLGEKELTSATLDEYIDICIKKMDNESQNLAKYFPWLIAYIIAHSEVVPGAGAKFDALVSGTTEFKMISDMIKIFEGTENWNSIKVYLDNGKYDSGLITALKDFITTFFECFTNVESIEFSITSDDGTEPANPLEALKSAFETWTTALASLTDITKLSQLIKVNYYEYSFSQDEFENYLVDHYIREMPEFYDIIKDENGKISEEKVYQLAYEIKTTKQIFDGLYKKDASAQQENACNGDINLDLLAELHAPIDMTVGQSITFAGENNYGLYKGMVHNGVDLEASSTGTKAGSKAYAIYDGIVTSSTADGTYPDKSANGGWVTIQYVIQYKDSTLGNSKLAERFKSVTSTIITYYGGLDSKKLTLKTGSKVKKGDVIGYVGSASDSEDGLTPSLHLGVYDLKTGGFLNPINMFITCKRSGSGNKTCGTKNEQKVWTFLLSKGYPKEAAAGIMGVWKRESNFKPYIVQSKTGAYSKKYTAKVDSGAISKNDFVKNGPGGNGYGLAQWTIPASRKSGLYDFAKKNGKSIGDLEVQLEFFEKEMKSSSYKKVRSKLMKVTTVEEATKIFLRDYEGGGSSSLKLRTSYAKDIYKKYKDYECK